MPFGQRWQARALWARGAAFSQAHIYLTSRQCSHITISMRTLSRQGRQYRGLPVINIT